MHWYSFTPFAMLTACLGLFFLSVAAAPVSGDAFVPSPTDGVEKRILIDPHGPVDPIDGSIFSWKKPIISPIKDHGPVIINPDPIKYNPIAPHGPPIMYPLHRRDDSDSGDTTDTTDSGSSDSPIVITAQPIIHGPGNLPVGPGPVVLPKPHPGPTFPGPIYHGPVIKPPTFPKPGPIAPHNPPIMYPLERRDGTMDATTFKPVPGPILPGPIGPIHEPTFPPWSPIHHGPVKLPPIIINPGPIAPHGPPGTVYPLEKRDGSVGADSVKIKPIPAPIIHGPVLPPVGHGPIHTGPIWSPPIWHGPIIDPGPIIYHPLDTEK